MAASSLYYVQQMEALRQEKVRLGDEIKQLIEQSSEGQQKVHQLMSAVNAEIANRHFKEINPELMLPSRISSAVSLMENEINRLELGMDMTNGEDTEFDSCIKQLKHSIREWDRLQSEIRSPIASSNLYAKSLEALSRYKKECFPNTDNVTTVDDVAFFEQINRTNESIQAVTSSSEEVMDDYSRSFDEAMSENVQKVSRGLDAQCVEVIRHFEDEKDERAELLSNMYSELLGKFLVDTEQSVSKYTNQYTSMSRKFRDESADDVLVPKTHHVVRGSWKTEIDSTVREVLQAQQCGREQEGRLDALLLKALDESKISVQSHGMDDSYLQKLMDKLTDLHLESSDIQFKQLKLTS